MFITRSIRFVAVLAFAAAVSASLLSFTPALAATHMATSGAFAGAKANKGTVSAMKDGDKLVLKVSDDFVVPDTPDPHWQVVDSKGNAYLLQRLPIKGDKVNREIVVPSYVKDVSKVVIWCAFAEVNLGEASFATPVR